MTAHWGVPDPAAVEGTREEVERAFHHAFVMLDRRISLFLSLPLATLDSLALQREIDGIGMLTASLRQAPCKVAPGFGTRCPEPGRELARR
jgi:hypothetical protein